MSLPPLEELFNALKNSPEIDQAVNSQIFKFLQIHDMEPLFKAAPYKTMVSCEISNLAGPKTATDPIFNIIIYSRNGDDNGASYCAEIANAIKTVLIDGWTGVSVESVAGKVSWNADSVSHQCKVEVRAHIKTTYTISLAASTSSPKDYGDDIVFVATASPSEAVQYRFMLCGPGTGSAWRDMTGWQSRNSFAWRPSAKDVGTSQIKVQLKAGPQSSGQIDQEGEALSLEITAPSGSGSSGSGTAPTITSLTPNLASPQAAETQIDCICIAADVDNDQLYFRFFLTGPGTASKKKLVQDWSRKNAWSWKPSEVDVGESTIEVQIRDGLHAAEGSYDDSESISYTVTTAGSGSGSGTAPTITSLTPNLASPQAAETQIDCICIATDVDNDQLYFRFFLTGPGTASKKKLVQDWSRKNAWSWKPSEVDVGESTIEVQIRDGFHAAEGSYDDSESISYTVTTAGSGSGTAPTITSLTPNLASPQAAETQIDCICIAADADSDKVLYRFYLTGPGTASKKKLVQDWSAKNAWSWTPSAIDVGTSTIEVQIRDANHAGEGSYDANTSISYTISATTNAAPTITSLTPNLASPRGQGTDIEFICIAADADSDKVLYRFFLTGPGTASKKKLVQDWSSKNAWSWTPEAKDIGSNTIEVQIRDANHAEEGSYDATSSINYTISSNTAPTITSVYVNEGESAFVGDTVIAVCEAADSNGDQILYRWELYRESIGAAYELLADWDTKNWVKITLGKMDYDSVNIVCKIRDAKHAGEESYDATSDITLTVNRAGISSVTPSLASPKANETTIVFTCTATKTNRLRYRFWQKGPGTGNVWRDMTGWTEKNSWSWRTLACDVGTNYVRCQVTDSEEAWSDSDTTGRQTDLTYTIS